MLSHRYRNFGYSNAWADRVDIADLINFVNRELSRCNIYLSDSDIRKLLNDLKDLARLEEYDLGGSAEDELVTKMKENLGRDLESSRSQGLYRSRSRFLVYCYVAHRINSVELAEALLLFFIKRGNDVVHEEKSFLLAEWCLGLQQLEGLVPEDKWYRACRQVASLGPPMFEEWRRPGLHHPWVEDILRLFHDRTVHGHGRGGSHHQLITPPVRRFPMPPPLRPSLIETPPHLRTGYNSPSISTIHETHALHLQQHLQALEVARLQRNFDGLRDRY